MVELVREPVGKRRSIIATVPAHGDLSPRACLYSLCSWSIQGPYYECNANGRGAMVRCPGDA